MKINKLQIIDKAAEVLKAVEIDVKILKINLQKEINTMIEFVIVLENEYDEIIKRQSTPSRELLEIIGQLKGKVFKLQKSYSYLID